MINEKITVHLTPPEEVIMSLYWTCPYVKNIDASSLHIYCKDIKGKPYTYSRVRKAIKRLVKKGLLQEERRFYIFKNYKHILPRDQYNIIATIETRTIIDVLHDTNAERRVTRFKKTRKTFEEKYLK